MVVDVAVVKERGPFVEPGVSANPFIGQLSSQYETRQPITRDGTVNLDRFRSSNYDWLIRHLAYAPTIRVEQIPEGVVVDVIRRIGDQVGQESKTVSGLPQGVNSSERVRHSRDGLTNLLENYRRNSEVPFPAKAIEIIKGFYRSDYPSVQALERDNIAKLIVVDERNNERGEGLGIGSQVVAEILEELRSHPVGQTRNERGQPLYKYETERRALAYTLACGKKATREIMHQFIEGQERLPVTFWHVFGNALGFETMRTYVNEYVQTHPEARLKFEVISKAVGLDKGEEIMFGPEDLYARAKFEHYGPYNELQSTDLLLLSQQLQGRKKIVDIGCGEGRHLIPLLKMGFPVEGVDMSHVSLERLLAKVPQAKVHIGSMNNLPFADGMVDAIYSLGRSGTHDSDTLYSIEKFKEFRRVLTEDGIVLFDLPSLGSEEMRGHTSERKKELWDKLRIWNREGTIHDSPDGKHFIDRFVLDTGQVYLIASLTGFTAQILHEALYKGASGNEAQNIYWKLTVNPRGPLGGKIEESQPLKYLSSTQDKGLDIDRY